MIFTKKGLLAINRHYRFHVFGIFLNGWVNIVFSIVLSFNPRETVPRALVRRE